MKKFTTWESAHSGPLRIGITIGRPITEEEYKKVSEIFSLDFLKKKMAELGKSKFYGWLYNKGFEMPDLDVKP